MKKGAWLVLALILLILTGDINSTDIHMNNGTIYKNVEVTGKQWEFNLVNFNKQKLEISDLLIDSIVDSPYNPKIKSELVFVWDGKEFNTETLVDIHFKDSTIMQAAKFLSATGNKYKFLIENKKRTLYKADIAYICEVGNLTTEDAPAAYDSLSPCNDKVFLALQNKESLTQEEIKSYIELKKLCEDYRGKNIYNSKIPKITVKEYQKLPALLFGVLSFGVSYYFFKCASENTDEIALAKRIFKNPNTQPIENNRNLNYAGGIGCGVLGVILSIVGLTPTEVQISPTKVSLSYKLGF